MKNLPFVLWMILFPVAIALSQYLSYLKGKVYSEEIETAAAIIDVLLYALVGFCLYNND